MLNLAFKNYSNDTEEWFVCLSPVCGQAFNVGEKKASKILFSLQAWLIILGIITVSLYVGKLLFFSGEVCSN